MVSSKLGKRSLSLPLGLSFFIKCEFESCDLFMIFFYIHKELCSFLELRECNYIKN
jgi:hypothetical protein